MKIRILFMLLSFFLMGFQQSEAALTAPSVVASPLVRTAAGDGVSGTRDGNGAQAEFMFPAALAYDRAADTLYVADPAAQAIRSIDRFGNVRTVAGSGPRLPSIDGVESGYADGPVSTARFHHPSGIVLASDGSLYVADAFNHCIRRVANNRVTTFAGKADTPGYRDGTLAAATFYEPRSLALASDGTLYVLDYTAAVRVVSPSGVRTLPLSRADLAFVTEIAVWQEHDDTILFLVRENDIARYDVGKHSFLASFTVSPQHAGGVMPGGIAVLDRDDALVSSPYWEAVYFIRFPGAGGDTRAFSRAVAGDGGLSDAVRAGGFLDAAPGASRFSRR